MDDDAVVISKHDFKQRLLQAKLKAAEKRAAEVAARQAEQQAATRPLTPEIPSPTVAPSFIRNFTQSSSNYASKSSPFLRSPTTKHERVKRANSLEALSKKIDRAGNFKLQELITKMIMKCSGAKELAESYFMINDVQSDNEGLDDREKYHAARHENGEGQSVDHVMAPRFNRNRLHPLGSQQCCQNWTNISNRQINEMDGREKDDPSALHPAIRPENSSIFQNNNEAPEQPDTQQQSIKSVFLEMEESTSIQAPANNDANLQKDNRATVQKGSETSALACRMTEGALDTPMNNAPITKISGSDISNAFDTLLNGIAKSRETNYHSTPFSATPRIGTPEANKNKATPAGNLHTSDILLLANDISAKYLALARAFGPVKFPYNQSANIGAGSPLNDFTRDFSFEAFNTLVDSIRKNIELMQKANKANAVPESIRNNFVLDDTSDLGSPIPIDTDGRELARNSISRDNTNPDFVEIRDTVNAEPTSSEEDEYADVANIPSSHYNCDGCRKPIVLPEGFFVSLENPAPTTCLHCQTRKASGITRRKFGARARPDLDNDLSTSTTDNQFPPSQVGHDGTEDSQTPGQTLGTALDRLESPSLSVSEPFPNPHPGPVPGFLEQFSTPVQAEVRNFGETSPNCRLCQGGNVKEEHVNDTIVVEIPAWHHHASPWLSTTQTPTDRQLLPSLGKRKVEKIEGEVIYPYPIGPKRRRGRPSKNFPAILIDSSPTSSPSASTPVPNLNSQETPTVKKRGRPLGSMNKFKSEETLQSNRPTSKRRSARKSREITQNLLTISSEYMQDLTYVSDSPIQTPILPRSDSRSIIPDSQPSYNWSLPAIDLTTQQDSDTEYTSSQGSEYRGGNDPITGTLSYGVPASSSFQSTVPARMDTHGSATAITDGRERQTPGTRTVSSSVNKQLLQSIEEQENRIANERAFMTIIGKESGNVNDRLTESLREIDRGFGRESGSIIESMTDKSRRSSGKESDTMRVSYTSGNNSDVSGRRPNKDGDSVTHGRSDQTEPDSRDSSSFTTNVLFSNFSATAHLIAAREKEGQGGSDQLSRIPTTTAPLVPIRSQPKTSQPFNPTTFFARSFGPGAPIPNPLPRPSRHRRSFQGVKYTRSFPRPLVPNISIPYPLPPQPPYLHGHRHHQHSSQASECSAHHTNLGSGFGQGVVSNRVRGMEERWRRDSGVD
ncbi:hypothetical protein SBOR_9738 [Sclerotinia borealis F-4128]|uniref:Uncharacterized protein n=1 Tax=Sclerotinia borealis (strain F-4128) TaxID=1432307 RepID=W9C4Q5_SCLBF|nr:hypothetical protein SBOR_9738 [Sclerotinia borealis F-4128]